jgi:DMSO/TMAO reductase YedYZ molybdopterin-dependent catalytic subunit
MKDTRVVLACLVVLSGLDLTVDAQTSPATLTVTGDITTPLALTAADLAKMPRATVSLREPDGSDVTYEGVSVHDILKRAGAPSGQNLRGKALASYVLAKARDGYQVVFALAELDPELNAAHIIVADRRDGHPLAASEGPLRIVCEGDKKPARSVRMLDALEIVRLQK